VDAHWVNGWFLRGLADPILTVDGTGHTVPWGQSFRVVVEPGDHRVAVGVRYGGFARILGQDEVTVQVADGETVQLRAKNGPFNGDPFRITAVR